MIGNLSAAFLGVVGQASGPPTVFTLVLDDLLTRWFNGFGQRFRLTATGETTEFISIDDGGGLYSASVMATDIQAKLEALTGYSGKVTVSGAETNAGNTYTFTITLDASLGAVTLEFDASSQWYPTITLTEAVTQQGVNDEDAVAEQVTITLVSDEDYTTVNFDGNDEAFYGVNGSFTTVGAPPSWTLTGGGQSNSTAVYVRNTPGVVTHPFVTSGAGVIVTVNIEGVDAVTGQPEIHTITPTPVNPTGGNCTIGGNSTAYDATPSVTGWTFAGNLGQGVVTANADANEPRTDDALAPSGWGLTAPEITHSIT